MIGASAFWEAYLPTILLGAATSPASSAATSPPRARAAGARWRTPRAPCSRWPLLGLALAYARAAAAAMSMLAPSNWNAVALFSTIALLVGYTMIVLSQLTHSVCGHSHQLAAPASRRSRRRMARGTALRLDGRLKPTAPRDPRAMIGRVHVVCDLNPRGAGVSGCFWAQQANNFRLSRPFGDVGFRLPVARPQSSAADAVSSSSARPSGSTSQSAAVSPVARASKGSTISAACRPSAASACARSRHHPPAARSAAARARARSFPSAAARAARRAGRRRPRAARPSGGRRARAKKRASRARPAGPTRPRPRAARPPRRRARARRCRSRDQTRRFDRARPPRPRPRPRASRRRGRSSTSPPRRLGRRPPPSSAARVRDRSTPPRARAAR